MSNNVKILINKEDLISMADTVRGVTNKYDKFDIDELVSSVNERVGTDPLVPVPKFTYIVKPISESNYGFAKNSDGYYESQNKGVHNSYAICRIELLVTSVCNIHFYVINYAENKKDYAIFSHLNSQLDRSTIADTDVKQSYYTFNSPNNYNLVYENVPIGVHYIEVKFIKNGLLSSYNDSVQFKILEPAIALSDETLAKINAADTNLTAENIRSGVDILGVTGKYLGGDNIIDRTIKDSYENAFVTTIGSYAFAGCTQLRSINFPAVTGISASAFINCSRLCTVSFPAAKTIGSNAFAHCAMLSAISFPAVTTIGSSAFNACSRLCTVSFPAATTISTYAFAQCASLTAISFPVATSIYNSAFYSCSSLLSADFPAATTISTSAFAYCAMLSAISFPVAKTIHDNAFNGCSLLSSISFPAATSIKAGAFSNCYTLTALYLTGSSICTLGGSNAFTSTPIAKYTSYVDAIGSIYVPASLLTTYQSATNWVYFSSRFVAIE